MFFLRLSLIVLAVFGVGLAAVYGSGIWGLMSAGYPRAVWPALGSYETVPGDPQPMPRPPVPRRLNERGRELFEASGGRALLVMRENRLVIETYADRIGPATRLNSFSLVKSLVGALVLKALSEGRLKSLDDRIGDYLPTFGSESFQDRPIRSFMEMRSGVVFETSYPDKGAQVRAVSPFGNLARLHAHGVQGVADKMSVTPEMRGRFSYQNANSAILGYLLSELYDQPLQALVSQKIWQPSGAADAFWLRHIETPDVTAYCCLYATARDWVRVGRFLMKNGDPTEQFLPEALWREYFGAGFETPELVADVYGLHLRHNILDRKGEDLQGRFSYMMGQGGQVVYMMPETDLVVVRFGEQSALLHSTLYAVWNSLSAK